MAQCIVMPKFNQATETSTIVQWLKREGDLIRKGDLLCEIETDKAIMEVESFHDGTLLKILIQPGQPTPVQTPIAWIGRPGELVTAEAEGPAPLASPMQSAIPEPSPAIPGARQSQLSHGPLDRFKISPRAAALARESGVDIATIKGSGPEGRIVEGDIKDSIQGRSKPNAPSPSSDKPATEAATESSVPLSKMRQAIARRLTNSVATIPHFFITVSVDATALEQFRAGLNAPDQRLSVTAFILKAVGLALREFPDFNSSTDGQSIQHHTQVNVGLAVAVDNGLLVVVLRDTDKLSLPEIHRTAGSLAERARAGKLRADEMTGSSFTISNLGRLGVDSFSAIINPGESGILAVGSIIESPVVLDGTIAVRSLMKLTLSADHRIVDGVQAARFLNLIRQQLESPSGH